MSFMSVQFKEQPLTRDAKHECKVWLIPKERQFTSSWSCLHNYEMNSKYILPILTEEY